MSSRGWKKQQERSGTQVRSRFLPVTAATCLIGAIAALMPAAAGALDWSLPASTLSGTFPNTPYPQVAAGPAGAATVVWRENDGSNDRIRASTQAPGGAWPNPATPGAVETISPAGSDASSPQVAIGADGTATAVWDYYDTSSGDYVIQEATRTPGQASFGSPQTLSQTGQSASSPQVAFAPDGTTTVVWGRSNGSNTIVQAATRPPGQSAFGTPQDLSPTGSSAYMQQVATSADGATVVVWNRSDAPSSTVIQTAYRGAGESSFGTPQTLSQTGQYAGDPKAVITSEGTTIVTWRRSNGTNLIIQAAMRAAGQASFSAPEDLSDAGQNAVVPEIAAAPDGTTTVAWNRSSGSGLVVQAATRQPGQTDFAAPEDLSPTGVSAFNQDVESAPDGATTVSWQRTNGVNQAIQATTRPPGGSWPDPNVAGSVTDLSQDGAGNTAQLPQMAGAANGAVAVTWQYYSPATGGANIVQAATSSPVSYPLSVTREGSGTGTVTSAPAGIDCGSACSASFALSSKVTLTATPASGSSFAGWGGSCSGSATTCTVTVLGARSASASFTPSPAPGPSNQFTLGRSRVAGNSIITRLAVPGAGQLTQRGTFRPRSGSRSAATRRTACRAKSGTTSAASTVTINCRLTAAARSERRRRAVAVTLCTTFTPSGGTARTKCRTVALSSRRPHYTG